MSGSIFLSVRIYIEALWKESLGQTRGAVARTQSSGRCGLSPLWLMKVIRTGAFPLQRLHSSVSTCTCMCLHLFMGNSISLILKPASAATAGWFSTGRWRKAEELRVTQAVRIVGGDVEAALCELSWKHFFSTSLEKERAFFWTKSLFAFCLNELWVHVGECRKSLIWKHSPVTLISYMIS